MSIRLYCYMDWHIRCICLYVYTVKRTDRFGLYVYCYTNWQIRFICLYVYTVTRTDRFGVYVYKSILLHGLTYSVYTSILLHGLTNYVLRKRQHTVQKYPQFVNKKQHHKGPIWNSNKFYWNHLFIFILFVEQSLPMSAAWKFNQVCVKQALIFTIYHKNSLYIDEPKSRGHAL